MILPMRNRGFRLSYYLNGQLYDISDIYDEVALHHCCFYQVLVSRLLVRIISDLCIVYYLNRLVNVIPDIYDTDALLHSYRFLRHLGRGEDESACRSLSNWSLSL